MKTNNDELKWYEKKRGISAQQKIASQNKKDREQKKSLQKQKKSDVKEKLQNNENYTPKNSSEYKIIESLFTSKNIDDKTKSIIENFDVILEKTHPLNSKQKSLLPKQIFEFSHNLTDNRQERRLGYMNSTVYLASYAHYYLWWNLVRLTKLFSNLPKEFFNLDDESTCVDFGTGPLTVIIALFLARPELRSKKLIWYCVDISQAAMTFGENIFYSVAAQFKCEPWKIIRIKGEFGIELKQKCALITCANMLNELKKNPNETPEFLAKTYASKILSYADSKSSATKILLVEPGVPQNARLLSLMRMQFIKKQFYVQSPCPHHLECPMQGERGKKWCNFSFLTDEAPLKLKKLSEDAKLPKERAVLSFIALSKQNPPKDEPQIFARIASDKIFLPHKKSGYYACSAKGLLLIVSEQNLNSGELVKVSIKENPATDEKTGAIIC